MKKLTLGLMTAFMLLTIIPAQSNAATKTTNPTTAVATKPVESTEELAEDNAIIARLNEIKAMDMSKLSPQERRDLRVEVRGDRDHFRHHRGVFISLGGLCLIILILILVL